MSLSSEEHDLINNIGRCMYDFMRLDVIHPFDAQEFMFHVHALQNIVMARAAVRDYPERYPNYSTSYRPAADQALPAQMPSLSN